MDTNKYIMEQVMIITTSTMNSILYGNMYLVRIIR